MTEAPRRRRLTGWGRAVRSSSMVCTPATRADVQDAVRAAGSGGLVARGLGRSYGDAALNGGGAVVRLPSAPGQVELDESAATIRVPAGTSIDELLRELVPRGWRVPVMPGTRYVTVGGAIAADVHGKNHHADGSFGHWVRELTLVDGGGDVRTLSPTVDPDAFWATVGGMGLTGVVVEAVLSVEPTVSTLFRARTRRFDDLDAVMDAMQTSASRYHVAWVDASPGRGFGRAVLDEGDDNGVADPSLTFAPRPALPVPPSPVNVVRPAVTRVFNAAWWRLAPSDDTRLVHLSRFFHPLDGLSGWTRAYGPHGFLQWQMAVPFDAAHLVDHSLRLLANSGAVPTLVVLKRFGDATPAPLSFPMPGWTLAVDVAARAPSLGGLLDRLDNEVADAGGRVYLAKDVRMNRRAFRRMYPRFEQWQEQRTLLDPQGRFTSDLARRLEMV